MYPLKQMIITPSLSFSPPGDPVLGPADLPALLRVHLHLLFAHFLHGAAPRPRNQRHGNFPAEAPQDPIHQERRALRQNTRHRHLRLSHPLFTHSGGRCLRFLYRASSPSHRPPAQWVETE